MLQWIHGLEKFLFYKPGVFILISNWIRFSRKKSCSFWFDQSPDLHSISHFVTILWRKGEEDYFFPELRVHIEDNNSLPHRKFYQFLFPFSSKFSEVDFASYVLFIYSWHTQWAWVTCDPTTHKELSWILTYNDVFCLSVSYLNYVFHL